MDAVDLPAYARCTRDVDHRYRLDDRPILGVTKVLDLTGLSDFSGPWFTPEVRDRGAHVAAAIALDHREELDEAALDPQLAPYVEAHRAFLRDSGSVVEFSEQIVCDEAYGYAGTLDEIVIQERNGRPRRILIDVKLGLYDSVAVQLAAYARAARDLYYPQAVVLERRALWLKPDGTYRLTDPFADPVDEHTFLAALKVVRWRQAHGLLPQEVVP